MTQHAFKFYYSDIQAKVDEYSAQIKAQGKEPLAQFLKSIVSILANKDGYKKFGVYWFAVKDILEDSHWFIKDENRFPVEYTHSPHIGVDFGGYTVDWLAGEYTEALDADGSPEEMTPMMILVAGYEFATNEGYIGGTISMPPPDEYYIAGCMWSIVDEDMLNYKGQ